jgi:hypothetical protein
MLKVYDFHLGSVATRKIVLASTRPNVCGTDRPKMNSVRDACRGCKAGKPIFLLFRLVESMLEAAAGPSPVSHASVTVFDEAISDCRL